MKKKVLSSLVFVIGAHLALAQTVTLPYNLWINGNFEGPDLSCSILNPVNNPSGTEFTTFIHQAGMSLQPAFVNEANNDHTFPNSVPNAGHYLYCDPRLSNGSTYQIRQTISVQPNCLYDLSVWVTSMRLNTSYAAAQVQLVINGVPVSNILTLSGITTNWQQLGLTNNIPWNSGSNTTAVVDIVALNPTVLGHDFAIDDIVFTPANLWVNGNFEGAGSSGTLNPVNYYSNANAPFLNSTTFRYVGSGPAIQPQYVNEASFDHTLGTGAGHFLYCDPRNATGSVYQIRRQITVQPNTDYDVSVWLTSMLLPGGPNGGRIRLVINNVPVTPILALDGGTTQWIELHNTIPWNSGSSTTATVDIIDMNPSIGGHDYAIDDIFFGASSHITPLIADAGPPEVHLITGISCGLPYTLGGLPSASGGITGCGNYTFQWSPTTYFVSPSNANSPNPIVLFSGVNDVLYTLTVTDAVGNTATDNIHVYADCPESKPTAINERPDHTGNINIYPNPVTDLLQVENNVVGNMSLQIIDPLGRTVFTKALIKGKESIDVSKLRTGMYYIQFNDNTTGTLMKALKFLKK
jgi:hypothetical protein